MYLREIEERQRRESKKMIGPTLKAVRREEKRLVDCHSRGWKENGFTCASWYTTAQTLHLRHLHDLHDRHCVYFY